MPAHEGQISLAAKEGIWQSKNLGTKPAGCSARSRRSLAGSWSFGITTGSLKGTYDPKSNETRDHTGRLVGKGNLLTTLLR